MIRIPIRLTVCVFALECRIGGIDAATVIAVPARAILRLTVEQKKGKIPLQEEQFAIAINRTSVFGAFGDKGWRIADL